MRPFASNDRFRLRSCVGALIGIALILCGAVATATTVTYTYDQYGRLKTSKTDNGTTAATATYGYDSAGNRTGLANTYADLAAPSLPTGLHGSVISATRIDIAWNAATDTGGSGLAGYKIFRDGTQIGTSATTSYSDTTVSGSHSYVYKVAAYDNATNTSAQSSGVTLSTPDTTPPSVPTNLASSSPSSTRVNLTWTASTDTGGAGLAGYRIYRGATQIGTSATNSYSDLTTSGSTSYTYKVAAYDAATPANVSAQSTGTTITTPDTIAPSTPTGLSASAAAYNRINLSWTASTDTGGAGLAGYRIYRGGTQIGTSATTTYADTTVAGSQTYTYKVAAYDAATPANVSAQSTAASATTPVAPDMTAPSVPTGLTSSAVSSTQVNLSWNASTDNVGGSGLQGYKIYRGGTQIGTSATTTYSDTTTVGSTPYTYTVASYDNSNNTSAQSTGSSVTTPDSIAPSVPTGLTGSAVSSTQVNLSWNASTDTGGSGLAGYKIYRGGTQIGTSATTSYSDTTTSGSTSYTYTVAAYDNASNTSAQSTGFGVTTPDSIAPSVPTGLTGSAPSSGQVNLSWNASTDTGGSGLAGYKIYRGGAQIGTSATTSYSDTTTSGSTSYTYTVAAYDNASNTSAQSAGFGVTTPDTIAPTTPTGLSASAVSPTQVNLSWSASSDSGGSGLAGYYVYRNGGYIGATSATSYADTTAAAGTSYTYTVAAYDNAGNVSGQSTGAGATTPLAWIQITDDVGNVIAAAQGRYAWSSNCVVQGGFPVCTYTLVKSGGGVAWTYTTTIVGGTCATGSGAANYRLVAGTSCRIEGRQDVY